MERAYSIVKISSSGTDEQRIITGLATSPVPDRVGDVVDPFGVTVAEEIPLLLFHDHTKVVGRAKLGKSTATGIPFEAYLPKLTEPGALKDRVDEAWAMLRHRLITGVSIAFRIVDGAVERLSGGGLKYLKTEIIELSLVPVPAHQLATIESVKSADLAIQRAHSSLTSTTNRGSAVPNYATLTINGQLELSLQVGASGKALNLALGRIQAQRLADELQSFAASRKSIDGRRELTFPLEVLPEESKATRAKRTSGGLPVMHLDSAAGRKKDGVLYLDKAGAKKPGVLYLDKPSSAGKRPVVRLNKR